MIHLFKFFTANRAKEPIVGEAKKDMVLTPVSTAMNCKVQIEYTNYRGERAWRTVVPHNIWHGKTAFHPDPQWLMTAWDIEKRDIRVFAMKDIHEFRNESTNTDKLRIDVVASPAPSPDHQSMTPTTDASEAKRDL